MKTKDFKVITSQSIINWVGKKVTGAHDGTIKIKSGTLNLDNGKLVDGNFIIDTTSIQILDIADAATNAQFAGHLFSADFFSTESFPEAILNITHVGEGNNGHYLLSGDLTIKGITHAINFPAEIQIAGNLLTASGKLFIDRTKYDMKFRSGNFFSNLGDTLIYNEFELDIRLTASASI